MKNYTEDIVNEIKLNNDIVDVVSEYVKLKKKGKDYFGLCPFHKEKTPSFSVAPNKGIFYCFGCQAGGSVIQFIMEIENLSYYEALDFLAKRANITVPEQVDPGAYKKRAKKEKILSINKIIARYYYNNLLEDKEALDYLNKRGIKNRTIKKYGLGYAKDSWDDLIKFLQSKKYSKEDIINAGLASENQKGNIYDKFRKRIMFPIFDVYDNIIAFGGRVLDDSKPKYLNSPETAAYHKREHLYGLNTAKKSRKDYFILVEGYFDVVSMSNAGYDNCVASLGTALTVRQVRMLNRYDKKIYMGYDSDNAGQKATMKALDIFSTTGVEPYVIVIKDAKDLDEFIQEKGDEEFKKLLDKSLSSIEYKITRIIDKYNLDNTQEKVNALKDIISILASLKDDSLIEMYTKKYSDILNISPNSMMLDINRKKSGNTIKINKRDFIKDVKSSINRIEKLELMLLLFYFNFDFGKKRILKYFENKDNKTENIEKIYKLLFKNNVDVTLSDILDKISKELVPIVISLNSKIETIDKDERGKALNDFLNNISKINLEIERDEIRKINISEKFDLSDKEKLRKFSEELKKQKRKTEEE